MLLRAGEAAPICCSYRHSLPQGIWTGAMSRNRTSASSCRRVWAASKHVAETCACERPGRLAGQCRQACAHFRHWEMLLQPPVLFIQPVLRAKQGGGQNCEGQPWRRRQKARPAGGHLRGERQLFPGGGSTGRCASRKVRTANLFFLSARRARKSASSSACPRLHGKKSSVDSPAS